MKDMKGRKLSDEKNEVIIKHFSGAKTEEIKSYSIPTLEENPGTVIIHTGNNDLKSDSSTK